MVLKLPVLYSITGLITLIGGLGIILYGIIDFNTENIIYQLLLFFILTLLGGVLFLQGAVSKIVLTDNEIIKISMFGKTNAIACTGVVSLTFNTVSLDLHIKSEINKIKYHHNLVGFPILTQQLFEKTGKRIY